MYKPYLDIGRGLVVVLLGLVLVAVVPAAAMAGREGVPSTSARIVAVGNEDSPYRAVTESPPHSLSTSHMSLVHPIFAGRKAARLRASLRHP